MRSLRGLMLSLGASISTGAIAALVAGGCGGDDTTTPGTADATADGGGHEDAPMAEAATPETGGQEATVEASADAGPAADAGGDGPVTPDGEAGPPQLPPPDWSTQEALAMCQGVLNCCAGGLDSGAYDVAKCASVFLVEGWFDYTLPERTDLYDAGNIAFDPAQGAACLAALRTFPCGAKTSAEWQGITRECFAALYGRIPQGQSGCRSSWECAPGTFCDQSVDGGQCSALVGSGQPCGNGRVPSRPDQMCSYLGSDQPALFCDLISSPDGGATCKPLLADGVTCTDSAQRNFYDMACTSGLCGDNAMCGGSTSLPFPVFCNAYIADAGGGG